MFKLKVYNKEEKDFIYKIMNLDLGHKTEEIYIKLPISEKEYITKLYDPYVVFNLYKMMSIGGDCYIDGDVSKSLLDNLEMYCNCWKIWLPDKIKSINILAKNEIDDEPKKLNNDAILSFTGGLDSTASLYIHYKGLAGRNSKNIKKLVGITGARDISSTRGANDITYQEIYNKKTNKMNDIAHSLGFSVVPIQTNLYETNTIFSWGDEFITLYVSIMMLYQDIYNNLIISSDQTVIPEAIYIPHASNPISNRFLKSNKFNLITEGEFLTRVDKLNIIKDSKIPLNKLLACDAAFKDTIKCCGICAKCVITKFNFLIAGIDVDFNELYDNPTIDFNYIFCGNHRILLQEMIYYYNTNNLDNNEALISKIKNMLPKYRNQDLLERYNILSSKYNKIINNIAWWIPVRKWRDNFRNKVFDKFIGGG